MDTKSKTDKIIKLRIEIPTQIIKPKHKSFIINPLTSDNAKNKLDKMLQKVKNKDMYVEMFYDSVYHHPDDDDVSKKYPFISRVIFYEYTQIFNVIFICQDPKNKIINRVSLFENDLYSVIGGYETNYDDLGKIFDIICDESIDFFDKYGIYFNNKIKSFMLNLPDREIRLIQLKKMQRMIGFWN